MLNCRQTRRARATQLAAWVAAAVATLGGAFAQEPKRTAFEVASIKPGDPSNPRTVMGIQTGRFNAANATLKMLIDFAYDVRDNQIFGGPKWIDSDRFTIEAKPEGAATGPQIRLMMQSLLEERFKLALHRETKDGQVFQLVVAKGGSKLKEVPDAGQGGRRGLMMGRGQLNGTAAPMENLVAQLSQQLGRPMIDKTGLTGKYDFTLQWTPDPGQGAMFGPPGADAPPPPDPNGPTIFTALQEQLGLRLESAKGPVEVLVIERAEKPAEN